MKKFIFSILFSLFLLQPFGAAAQTDFDGMAWQDIKLDYSLLKSRKHPRLLLTDKDIKGVKKDLKRNPYLASFHKMAMDLAESLLADPEPLKYEKDESGRRILKTSNQALRRIASLSYAYRITRNRSFLDKAEWYLNTVCDFPDWNPSHFLDPSEMAMGVSIGYDWLYSSLRPETRAKVEKCLREFAMEEVAHGIGQHIFARPGNWNQWCTASMTAASIVTYELNPELSDEIIRRGLQGNIRAAKEIYSPDGVFPEGPGYWDNGNCYQEFLNIFLEDNFGSDFGLSRIEGFSKTSLFKAFCRSGAGHVFNFSDSTDIMGASPGLWYMAWKFGNPGVLYDELQFLGHKSYPADRRMILSLVCSYRLGKQTITPLHDRLYVGRGSNHILMAKTCWDKDGLYLGLKGGSADVGHSHMDAGSFVFDAYGTRWAHDYYARAYAKQELIFAKLGLNKSQYAYTQDSYRWHLFQYNNRQHTTLTVNGQNHIVSGFASIVDSWDGPSKVGGKLDLTAVLKNGLESASRSASIVDNSYLEVVDELQAPSDTAARIRWTLISKEKVKILPDGILLSDGKTEMKLSTDAPGAVFRTWSSNPKDYDSPTAFGEPKFKNTRICGFEFDIPAGEKVVVTTTMKKQ